MQEQRSRYDGSIAIRFRKTAIAMVLMAVIAPVLSGWAPASGAARGGPIPLDWETWAVAHGKPGYGLELDRTKKAGVYRALLTRHSQTGNISDVMRMTIRIDGRDRVYITWPGGDVTRGVLSRSSDGYQDLLQLDNGCWDHFPGDVIRPDCWFYPE